MARSWTPGRTADAALSALIVLAPLAAGSWKLEVLPVLLGLAIGGWIATGWSLRRRRRKLHIGLLTLSLLALAVLTAAQAVPLPADLLALLSPRAAELRRFVQGGDGSGPLSYEPGATFREATKLLLYAMVAQLALERARGVGVAKKIAQPLLVAGVVASGVAILHRVLGIDRLFGLLDNATTTRGMLTTFVNPNHTGSFMALVGITAIGLAVRSRHLRRKVAFTLVAVFCVAVAASTGSKGGIGALLLGLVGFAALYALRHRGGDRPPLRSGVATAAAAVLLVPAALFTWSLDNIAQWIQTEPGGTELGLAEKAAAMQDALPMIMEHRWLGIGRGAYVSVYTRYQTSDLQLTFTFPENIVAQLSSEWGLIAGLVALVGLGAAVLSRLWSTQNTSGIAMLCGVGAVLTQNLVDFGLEMPGLAIPAIAILGATSSDWTPRLRIPTRSWAGRGLLFVAPAAAALTCALAFSQGDLPRDLAEVQSAIAQAQRGAPRDPPLDLAPVVARHPASALMAAQAAYLCEISTPPRLEEAVRWANRALYLAPRYADGHLVAGRLLVRAGYRAQGFGELRRAWAQSGPDRRALVMRHILDLAKGPEEVARAVPRRDPALDRLSERELALAVRHLTTSGHADWARALLSEYLVLDEIPPEDMRAVSVAADAAGATALALELSARHLASNPNDAGARLFAARVAFRHGELAKARALLDGLTPHGDDAETLLELRLRLETAAKDVAAGEATLRNLRAIARPGRARDEQLATLEAALYRHAGELDRAQHVLDRALAAHPGSMPLRMQRARLLLLRGRNSAAVGDLEHVLRRQPAHAEARALLERARGPASPR